MKQDNSIKFKGPRGAKAFTLIELLVVIAIIGVLVSMLMPALGKAKRAATAAADLTAVQQLMTAYSLYSGEFRGAVLPGYIPSSWASPTPPPNVRGVDVLDDVGNRLYGVLAQRYPWRLAPYLDYNFAGLYKNAHLLAEYRERSDYHYIISVSPSFGLNSDFVGGKALPGFGFNPTAARAWGAFYVTRMDEVRRPDNLTVFASAHGVNPNGGDPVEGYYEVSSPMFTSRRWSATYNREDEPGVHGNVDARYDGKVMTGNFDGHAALLSPLELEDMRRWSNQAKSADWYLQAR